MKKLLAIGTLSLISSLALANKPLVVQYGEPEPMAEQQAQNDYVQTSSPLNNISLNAGYVGGMIDKDDFKLRLKGFELGGTYSLNEKFGIFAKYEQQKDDLKLKEFSAGAVYNFYERNNVYITGSAGLGYSWVDGKDDGDKVELEYLTLPIGLELGYKFTPSVAVYGGLGYKWMYNQDSEVCFGGVCYDAGNLSELDVNGTTYRAGFRYTF
ncbi:outer membrane beta-barrel protein [Acinetobacter sp. WCHAc060007]|uniref:outer membrane beta-barrel protein n=1 Tax=Acinetobacter sp. WCHAc060007 TaxID=2419605 RepID=UPI000EA21928|nr:hypothetical protein [Acinetobacter sp. WCHAc060007]RKG37876.1 hypothetical protein D7V31_15995 [Acinetobacter sp. WCHAc060007]